MATGRFDDVTVMTADAGENCVTLADGTKLSVVRVVGFGSPYMFALARSKAPPKMALFSFKLISSAGLLLHRGSFSLNALRRTTNRADRAVRISTFKKRRKHDAGVSISQA